ncbi:MAG: hypothetical protein ACR2M0_12510 [Chloroflexia bacterium]
MTQQALPAGIQAQIQGEISGQIAVGNYNVQIGSVHGGVVNLMQPGQQPVPRPRPMPVYLRPRQGRELLGRATEIGAATAALATATPVEFWGAGGLGKSALLRALAYAPSATSLPDGVIQISALHQPQADLLQCLYDAFYECDVPFKPTSVQIGLALQPKRALILVDDLELDREETQAVMDAAPGCGFVVAGTLRRLWDDSSSLAVHGLPDDAALALVERELARPLTPDERATASAICSTVGCSPLGIIQAVAEAREGGVPLVEVLRRRQAALTAVAAAQPDLSSLPAAELRLLALLADFDGAPVQKELLDGLLGGDSAPLRAHLLRRGLIQAHSPSYSLAGDLAQELPSNPNLWLRRALAYFTEWTAPRRNRPDLLEPAFGPILATLEHAANAGEWFELMRLGRTVEPGLALLGRWGAWEQVLSLILSAARATGDRTTEARALHQLGTRSLGLGNTAGAQAALSAALQIREALGDQIGAAVTRHNLGFVLPPPPPPQGPPQQPPPPDAPPPPPGGAKAMPMRAGRSVPALLGGLAVVLLVGLIGLVLYLGGGIPGLGHPTDTPTPALSLGEAATDTAVPASDTAVPPSSTPTTCPSVAVSGAFTAGDSLENGMTNFDHRPGTCDLPARCMSPVQTGTQFLYNAYSFTNESDIVQCVSVIGKTDCRGLIVVAAYLKSFDPQDLCAGYLGDQGVGNGEFGFSVPPRVSFIVVVQASTGSVSPLRQICATYTLSVKGTACISGGTRVDFGSAATPTAPPVPIK